MILQRSRMVSAWVAVAAVLGAFAACSSTPPATPARQLEPPVTTPGRVSTLAFDKQAVDLGSVYADQEGVQTFLVLNPGDEPMQVGPAALRVVQGCDAAEVEATVMELADHGALRLPVRLGPHTQTGPHELAISVPASDAKGRPATLSIRFDVQPAPSAPPPGPSLRVDKKVIDIGAVPYDWPLYEEFTLHNAGSAALVLEGTPEVRVEDGC